MWRLERSVDLGLFPCRVIPKDFKKYNFGREVTFSIQVAIIAISNTLLNVIIQYI